MLFIFDWDGTLCSSIDRIVTSVQRAATDLGLAPLAYEDAKSIIGLGLQEAMNILFPSLPEPERAELVLRYKHHFISLDAEVPSPLYDDALYTLDSLRSAGHSLAVATGKGRDGLDRVLQEKNLGQYFDATRCADETKSKPHPLMLQELLTELGFSAQEAIMIGDTDFDLAMANAAGMQSIGVSYGAHDLDRLKACNPVLIVDRLATILEQSFE